jgi:uncharacterized membrane protein
MSQPNPQPVAKSDQTFWIYLAYIFEWLLGLIGLAVVKDDDRVRFHCAQSFTLSVAFWVINIVLWILSAIFVATIILSPLALIIGVLQFLFFAAYYVYKIILIVQVAQGKDPKIPVCANFAEKNVVKWFK